LQHKGLKISHWRNMNEIVGCWEGRGRKVVNICTD